jgi:hypothetical protein
MICAQTRSANGDALHPAPARLMQGEMDDAIVGKRRRSTGPVASGGQTERGLDKAVVNKNVEGGPVLLRNAGNLIPHP